VNGFADGARARLDRKSMPPFHDSPVWARSPGPGARRELGQRFFAQIAGKREPRLSQITTSAPNMTSIDCPKAASGPQMGIDANNGGADPL
jgi:hypothetical protein